MQPILDLTQINLASLMADARQKVRPSDIPSWVWLGFVVFIFSIAVIITLRRQKELIMEEPNVRGGSLQPEIDFGDVEVAEFLSSSTPSVEPDAVTSQPDNLKKIKGIGPKIEKLLHDHGITTFSQIAEMKADAIQALLDTVDWTDFANPTTWPEQAREFFEASKKDHKQ
ncbi:MAG: hypothetical protein KDJ65_11870 [Anaerolineae bacterium]|nr:hypothetical protein [Anaerolineae bacterium]